MAFYVPFILDPEFFRDTFAYIFGHRLAGEAPPKFLPRWWGVLPSTAAATIFGTLVALTWRGWCGPIAAIHPYAATIPLIGLLIGAMAAL